MSINRVHGVPFAQIANSALRDKRLSFRARGILAMMLSHTGEWRATRDWIASQTDHEGRQAIQTALNELTALGYRKVSKQQGPDGRWQNVTHWFHVPNGELVQESTEPAGELVQETGRRLNRPSVEPAVGFLDGHSEEESTEEESTEHHQQNKHTRQLVDRFDDFWHAYPRKRDKGAARKAWAKAITATDPDVIVAAAHRYAADPRRDPTYTKYPATWLNSESWHDEPDETPRGDSGPISAYLTTAMHLADEQRLGIAQ